MLLKINSCSYILGPFCAMCCIRVHFQLESVIRYAVCPGKSGKPMHTSKILYKDPTTNQP